jgi:hypothetical protein
VWSTLNYDIQVDFTTADELKAFFNAGGWIGFDTSVVPDNYVQRTQQVELEQLDTIRMTARTSESTGLRKMSIEYGDGVITDGGCAGVYGLTAVTRTVWSSTLVSASGTGSTQYDGTIRFSMDAYQSSPTTIVVSFIVVDNSDPAYINDTEGGAPSFQIQAVTGRADPAILFSPSHAHPTVTVLGTTSW